MNESKREERISEILKQPYNWVFVPEETGWTGFIAEFPGCITQGETEAEMFPMLRDAAELWLTVALDHGDPIPEPRSKSIWTLKRLT